MIDLREIQPRDIYPSKISNCRRQIRDWRCRLYHECCTSNVTFFVTLTISDTYLPLFTDTDTIPLLQKFMKRLRRNITYYYHKRDKHSVVPKFKYFLVSEHGEQSTHRLHFHVFFFFDTYISKYLFLHRLNEDWYYGFINSQTVYSYKSVNYVTKYISKKFIETSYKLQSQHLGQLWFDINRPLFVTQLEQGDKPRCSYNGCQRLIPRYYLKQLLCDADLSQMYHEIVDASYPQSLDIDYEVVTISSRVERSLSKLIVKGFWPDRYKPFVIGFGDNPSLLQCELPRDVIDALYNNVSDSVILSDFISKKYNYEEFKLRAHL